MKTKAARRRPASAPKPKAGPKAGPKARPRKASARHVYLLRLYVAGQTPKSLQAFANLKQICEQHLAGRYKLEVIDLMQNPALARGDQILALPALVRQLPPPMKKIIGDFTDAERVLVGLDLKRLQAKGSET